MARRARVEDVGAFALAMPGARRVEGTDGRPIFQVSGRSFVFFRNPRPDAVDPVTGARLDDVIVIWVSRDVDKWALVADESTPFFTTPHFDGHRSVLVQAGRLGEIDADHLREVIEDAWLARASRTAARRWLATHPEVETLEET